MSKNNKSQKTEARAERPTTGANDGYDRVPRKLLLLWAAPVVLIALAIIVKM